MNSGEIREHLKEALEDAPAATQILVEKLVHSIRHENKTLRNHLEQASKERDESKQKLHQLLSEIGHLKEELTVVQHDLHAKERALSKLDEVYTPPDYGALKPVEEGHLQLKVKCMRCSLHFIICTQYEDLHTVETIFCPECGKRGRCILWSDYSDEFIFQVVPGKAEIRGMNIGR